MKAVISVLGLILAAACGTGTPQTSNVAASNDAISGGTFRLENDIRNLHEIRTPDCDRYTLLVLGDTTQLEDALSGSCKMLVPPRPRSYALSLVDTNCGSKIYSGDKVTGPEDAPVSIQVTDHRSRVCRDRVPAPVIVTETFADGHTETLYASYVEPAAETYTGQLIRMAAIGGETSGYGLRTADGTVLELDLSTNGFDQQFFAGRNAQVAGVITQVHGVEIPTRNVLVVTSLTFI
jgi:hypothetical protein